MPEAEVKRAFIPAPASTTISASAWVTAPLDVTSCCYKRNEGGVSGPHHACETGEPGRSSQPMVLPSYRGVTGGGGEGGGRVCTPTRPLSSHLKWL